MFYFNPAAKHSQFIMTFITTTSVTVKNLSLFMHMLKDQEFHPPRRTLCRVFLCHNSADKAAIKDIADRLELDFGVPHFLDAFSIPTGEAFKA
jgi:hypothetical protein